MQIKNTIKVKYFFAFRFVSCIKDVMIKQIYEKTIKACYDWAMGIARKKNAVWMLVIVSFIESSFFPIPPDIFLIPLVLSQRQRAFRIAFYCTIASVLGGYFGYAIGYWLDETLLSKLLNYFGWMAYFERFKYWYHEYGAWIVFTAGLTPFPYKIITIASGAVSLNIFIFTIASVLARGLRFFIITWALYKWGKPMQKYIEKNLGWLSILFVLLLFLSFLLIKFL